MDWSLLFWSVSRCIIRMTLKRINECSTEDQAEDLGSFVDSLNNQYQHAVDIAVKANRGGEGPPEKELAWLYKHGQSILSYRSHLSIVALLTDGESVATAFNAAIQGAQEGWNESVVYGLFEASVAVSTLRAITERLNQSH